MAENLLQLIDGAKSFGARSLFSNATVSANKDEHIGVIGPNGAGKSTFFRILVGQEQLDEGRIVRSKELSLGYLSQHDEWEPGETGNHFLERKTKIPIWEMKARGRELRMPESLLEKPISSLSGGYRMRVKLLAMLGQAPNLMLLDEPTNYLDLETTLVLERFLQGFDGAFLLISHDREFLKRTTDHTLEIADGDFTKYSGNIDDYFEQKELLETQLRARAQGLADKRASVMEFVTRFGAQATKARQAQSKLKMLGKMEKIEIKPVSAGAVIRIPAPTPTGEMILQVTDGEFGYPGRDSVIRDVNLRILRGDRIGIVGFNGVGKSTLLKGLARTLASKAGEVQVGHNVRTAFFHQHVVESLEKADNVYESLAATAHPDVLRQEILDLAGSLLFSGEDVRKKISMLSGGECTRVALGRVLLQKAPCLILDEPTNHLDFQTVEAMTQALGRYKGTVITVSHDRGFIQRVASKIVEISDGKVRLYPGTYDEYVWHLQQELGREDGENDTAAKMRAKEAAAAVVVVKSQLTREEKKENEKRNRVLDRQIQEIDQKMSVLSTRIQELNASIAETTDGEKLRVLVTELAEKSEQLNKIEVDWIYLSEERARD